MRTIERVLRQLERRKVTIGRVDDSLHDGLERSHRRAVELDHHVQLVAVVLALEEYLFILVLARGLERGA